MTYNEFEIEWNSDSEDVICHTSGSTGVPNDIKIPKIQMRNSAQRTIKYFNLNSDSHLHSCISPDFIGGKMVFVRSAICGCSYSWEIPTNQPLKNYVGKDIDIISVVPSQMLYILENKDKMPTIHNYLIGGSSIPNNLRDSIVKTGISAFESYGMTETASHIAIRKITNKNTPFTVLDGITIEEIDGVLKINIDGWQSLITNDCVKLISNKQFYVIGRSDNVIISGGKKINPETIENILSGYFDFPFAISSIPDEKWGEKLVLVAECESEQLNSIKLTAESILHGAEKPKLYLNINQIPRTENGKIKRSDLRKQIIKGSGTSI